jgi:hypothetical protein
MDQETLPAPVAPEEFVCRSCFLVKRRTQLADPEQMWCRDCSDNARDRAHDAKQ